MGEVFSATIECTGCGQRSAYVVEWSINPDIDWDRDSGSGKHHSLLTIYDGVLKAGQIYNVHVSGGPPVNISD